MHVCSLFLKKWENLSQQVFWYSSFSIEFVQEILLPPLRHRDNSLASRQHTFMPQLYRLELLVKPFITKWAQPLIPYTEKQNHAEMRLELVYFCSYISQVLEAISLAFQKLPHQKLLLNSAWPTGTTLPLSLSRRRRHLFAYLISSSLQGLLSWRTSSSLCFSKVLLLWFLRVLLCGEEGSCSERAQVSTSSFSSSNSSPPYYSTGGSICINFNIIIKKEEKDEGEGSFQGSFSAMSCSYVSWRSSAQSLAPVGVFSAGMVVISQLCWQSLVFSLMSQQVSRPSSSSTNSLIFPSFLSYRLQAFLGLSPSPLLMATCSTVFLSPLVTITLTTFMTVSSTCRARMYSGFMGNSSMTLNQCVFLVCGSQAWCQSAMVMSPVMKLYWLTFSSTFYRKVRSVSQTITQSQYSMKRWSKVVMISTISSRLGLSRHLGGALVSDIILKQTLLCLSLLRMLATYVSPLFSLLKFIMKTEKKDSSLSCSCMRISSLASQDFLPLGTSGTFMRYRSVRTSEKVIICRKSAIFQNYGCLASSSVMKVGTQVRCPERKKLSFLSLLIWTSMGDLWATISSPSYSQQTAESEPSFWLMKPKRSSSERNITSSPKVRQRALMVPIAYLLSISYFYSGMRAADRASSRDRARKRRGIIVMGYYEQISCSYSMEMRGLIERGHQGAQIRVRSSADARGFADAWPSLGNRCRSILIQ